MIHVGANYVQFLNLEPPGPDLLHLTCLFRQNKLTLTTEVATPPPLVCVKMNPREVDLSLVYNSQKFNVMILV